jgi:hypothetical protein
MLLICSSRRDSSVCPAEDVFWNSRSGWLPGSKFRTDLADFPDYADRSTRRYRSLRRAGIVGNSRSGCHNRRSEPYAETNKKKKITARL